MLNDIQRQQLALLSHGKTSKEAALILGMTIETFNRRLETVRLALNARTTHQAVFIYATHYVNAPDRETSGRLRRILLDLANGITDDCE